MKNRVMVFALLGLLLPFVGCGGSSTGSTMDGSNISVAISPLTATVSISQTQQFSAVVSNTSDQAVNWMVSGVAGGNAVVGTISNTGLYTAPIRVPSAAPSVSATSVADSTKAGTAVVTVQGYSGILSFHNDAGVTGQNLKETILTPSNVNQTHFGKLFSHTLDGQSYSQPLYVSNLPIPGQGTHNVVFVATEHDTVYAFDADASTSGPLWSVNFTDLAHGVTTIPGEEVGGGGPITPEVGITGTPVIDGNSGTLYAIAATKENGTYIHRLHALDITTGAERFGGPVVIQASVPGTGEGSVAGQLAFDTTYQLQRAGLLLADGVVYIAWASYNDVGPYHGWVIGYDAATLAQVRAWTPTPNGERGGIWLGGASMSADTAGQIFVIAGNGTFDANIGGADYGDTFLKLAPNGNSFRVNDYFTPFNQQILADADIDVGSSGFTLLPDQPGPVPHLAVSAGKEGTIYLMNRDQMGQFQSGSDSQIVQYLALALGSEDNDNEYSTATYWQGNVYFIGHSDVIKQFQLRNGLLSESPIAQGSTVYGYPGANMSVSANGVSNGIVWSIEASGEDVLHAYDANNVAIEFYNSDQASGGRDNFGTAVRFSVPTIINGKVYVAGKTNFAVFGLL